MNISSSQKKLKLYVNEDSQIKEMKTTKKKRNVFFLQRSNKLMETKPQHRDVLSDNLYKVFFTFQRHYSGVGQSGVPDGLITHRSVVQIHSPLLFLYHVDLNIFGSKAPSSFEYIQNNPLSAILFFNYMDLCTIKFIK